MNWTEQYHVGQSVDYFVDPASEDEDIQNEIRETAEADLTPIGHATLKSMVSSLTLGSGQ